MSESDLIPGYLNKSHVPPILFLPSKIKNDLFASVKFVSEVISVKRDKDDKIIEGNPNKIKHVIDYWKFTRNILKKGPNWYLSEIVSK